MLVSGEKTANVSIMHFANVMTEYLYPVENFIVNNPHALNYELSEDLLGLTLTLRVNSDRIGCVNTDNIDVVVHLSLIDEDITGDITAPVRITFKNDLLDKAYEIGAYLLPVTIHEDALPG